MNMCAEGYKLDINTFKTTSLLVLSATGVPVAVNGRGKMQAAVFRRQLLVHNNALPIDLEDSLCSAHLNY